jgi:hypothetical protein
MAGAEEAAVLHTVPRLPCWSVLLGMVSLQAVVHCRQNSNIHIRWEQASNQKLAGLNTLKFSVWISRGAGLCLSVDTMLILLPMCRTILRYVRPKARWLHLDESIWFHRQVAYSMLLYTIAHTGSHYVK